ncbi:MAG: hypothetical protein JWM80_4894 [Cyanobacteria bacterium RYN_339]|nr:hypothetical protein [Cyanobacteria bacterium RYN_339]
MRRLLLATMIASLLAGCGATPDIAKVAKGAANPLPTVRQIVANNSSRATVTIVSSVQATAAAMASSSTAAADLASADSHIDSIEWLIQDGGAYLIQSWFGDIVDKVKDIYKRWKLSREVKAALKKQHEEEFGLHEDEIAAIKKGRSAVSTKIKALANGDKEIITTWDSTEGGTFHIETARIIDEDGVTQVLALSQTGTDKKGQQLQTTRTRTLTSAAGDYTVATDSSITYKDNRKQTQHWSKSVSVDGSAKIEGYIVMADGARTDITGTRDTKGKVKLDVSKITKPAPGA